MKTLTVFTPAYNRAHTIGRTYESLCRQTSKDFEWLVVDDGSKDNTRELVEGWIKEGKIDIRYVYQENQGMHGAHNTAYDHITTELNTCIDSDDFMPDDAVEKIVTFWKEHGSDKYAGIIGLDATEDGKVIGNNFPDGLQTTTLRRYYEELGGNGDKKMIYRTDVVKKYPKYPLFEGERYVGLDYLYHMIDKDYELLVTNNVYVIVEYQLDGSSFGMWKQYWNNPKGWAFYRKFEMTQTTSWKRKIQNNIHYVSHSIRSKNWNFLKESPMKLMTFFCFFPGVALYFVNKDKIKKNTLYGK